MQQGYICSTNEQMNLQEMAFLSEETNYGSMFKASVKRAVEEHNAALIRLNFGCLGGLTEQCEHYVNCNALGLLSQQPQLRAAMAETIAQRITSNL